MRENGFSYWIKWYNFKEFYVYYVRCYLTLRSLNLSSFISSCLCKQLILEPFLFPTLQFKKEITLMHQQSTVKYLSEFLVCEEQNCFQSTNICHKSYFREAHFNIINNKKTTHKSVPFDQSIQYINFYNIAKIENILTQKITDSLKGFTTNLDAIVQGAIYNSELFLEIFGNSQAAIAEYLYLRSIQKGNEMGMVYAFNQVLCVSLLTNQDKKVSKCYKELCKENAEWENLNAEFNLASGINSTHLESFIQREIVYFAAYCQKLAEEKKEFNILNYISLHNSSSEYQNDIYYYNSQFTSFLTAKYEKNPEKQQIFSVGEYYLHFWEFFYLIFDANANKNVINYFEEEVSFYQEYESIMAQIGLKESFLSFRMWRLNHKVSKWKPSLKNPFFLESYIYSFIEQLIYKKLYYPEEKRSYDFKEFSKYIKDYVKFVNEKKEQFSFVRYREYFDFRKKNDNFEESLKKNKEVIYSKVYYLEYIHSEFVEGNRVALKKYKKHQENKMIQEAEKAASFRTLTENLKNTLAEEEKDRFYEIVFINYINSVQEDNETPTKENYYQYKSNVLQNFDETYLQEEEANYKQALAEQMEQVDLNSDKEKDEGKKNEIVKEEINAIEEKIAEIIEDEDRSEDSSEDDYEEAVICPCCNGKPFDCKEKECIVMGCCTACMLD